MSKIQLNFTGKLSDLISKAQSGDVDDIDYIMSNLTADSSFAMTRYVDFSLSLVTNNKGIERIKYYLFNGSLIQRNYASLFLNRSGNWKPVKEAYEKGLIDEIQAFAR